MVYYRKTVSLDSSGAPLPKPRRTKKPPSGPTKKALPSSASIGKPLTVKHTRALSEIEERPGLTYQDYTILIYGYSTSFVRSSVQAAINGLIRRNLVRYCALCHCGAELIKLKNRRRCSACGSIYAEVYIKEDRIKPV